jgi:hypothetical protein
MWNSFRLLTSLSYNDIITQGSTIGFYPDDPTSWAFISGATNPAGHGTVNNFTAASSGLPTTVGQFNDYNSGLSNTGYVRRMSYVNYDPDANCGSGTYSALFPAQSCKNMWKSYVSQKVNGAAGINGTIQISVVATIYLKHIHSFFAMVPLLKGAFFKMTMNLNNTTTALATTVAAGALTDLNVVSVSNPVGGVNPLMFSSASALTVAGVSYPNANSVLSGAQAQTFLMNVSVGAVNLGSGFTPSAGGQLARSVYLYVPALTFNPVFETAYLSSPIKSIKYTDVYQYQVINVQPNSQFNNLLTNGEMLNAIVLPKARQVLCY